MSLRKKIFAVDDESDILEILKINLESEGYEVLTYTDPRKAFDKLKGAAPDLVILDVMMEGMDGYEFCRAMRAKPEYASMPVIFLSAKSDELDKVLGLEFGGDDYITKPFSVKELKSRVKAVLRRSAAVKDANQDEKILSYRGIELYPEQYQLKVDGDDVQLTKTEFGILHLLLKNHGKVFSRDNLIDSIRGQDVYVVDRTIDVHIMNLRKKLGRYKNVIKTISGVGYAFKDTEE